MGNSNLFLNRFLLPLLMFFVVGNVSGQVGCPANTNVYVDASTATDFDLDILDIGDTLCVYTSVLGQHDLEFEGSINKNAIVVHFEESSNVNFTNYSIGQGLDSPPTLEVSGVSTTENLLSEDGFFHINVAGESADFNFSGVEGSYNDPFIFMTVTDGAQVVVQDSVILEGLDVDEATVTFEKDVTLNYVYSNFNQSTLTFKNKLSIKSSSIEIIESLVQVGDSLKLDFTYGGSLSLSGSSQLVVTGDIVVENSDVPNIFQYSTEGRVDTCAIITAKDISISNTNTKIANSDKIKLCDWENVPDAGIAGDGEVIDGVCPTCPTYEELNCQQYEDQMLFDEDLSLCFGDSIASPLIDQGLFYQWFQYYDYGYYTGSYALDLKTPKIAASYDSYFVKVAMPNGCILTSDTTGVVNSLYIYSYLNYDKYNSLCTESDTLPDVLLGMDSESDLFTVYYEINGEKYDTIIPKTINDSVIVDYKFNFDLNFDTTLISNGAYKFVLDSAESGGCVVYPDIYSVVDATIYQSPIISIDSSKLDLCSEISLQGFIDAVTVTPDAANLNITDPEGNGILGDPTNGQSIVLTANNNGCESFIYKTVSFGDIDYTLSSDTVSGCVPEVVTSPPTSFDILNGVLEGVSTGAQVVWSSDVFEFENNSVFSPKIKADSKGEGFVFVTLGSSSCSVTDSVYVIISEVEDFEDVTIYDCGDGVLLDSSFINNNPDYSLYVIGDNSVEYYLGDKIDYSEDYKSTYGGNYYVTITDPYFCRSTYGVTIEEQIFDYDSTILNPSCGEKNGAITWGNSNYTYQWLDGSGNIIGTESTLPGLSAGTYTSIVQETSCTDTIEFLLEDADVFYTKTSTNKTIDNLPDNTALDVVILNTGTSASITWYSDIVVFEDDTLLSPTITRGEGLGYAYFEISDDTCTYTDSIQLFVLTTPTATDDYIEINEDESICVDVLGNDIDNNEIAQQRIAVSYSGLGVSVIENPASGTILLNNDTVCYTPIPNYYGFDTIIYKITDEHGKVDTAKVFIEVLPVNDAPYVDATNLLYTLNEDDIISIDILGNIIDVDDDSLSITSFSATNGIVVLLNKDSLTYIPYENYNGQDTIFYTVSDGTDVLTHTIPIVVLPVNDAPIANDTTITLLMNTDTSIVTTVIYPILNDTDVDDGDVLSLVSVTGLNYLEYTPEVGFIGEDTLFYSVSDGTNTSTANIYINVISSATYAELSFADSICVGDQVPFNYTSLGFPSGARYSLEVEDSSYVFGTDVSHTFTSSGLVEVGLNIIDATTNLDTTIIDSIYVQGTQGLSAYDITYSGVVESSHVVGQENIVFSCGTVEASFSSNDLSIFWEGFNLGNEYAIIGQEVVYFDVSDGLCSIIDSVQIEYNNNVSDSIGFDLNTFNASDQVYVRWDDFQSIASATINRDETNLLEGTTVNIVEEEGEFIVEYAAEENVTGSQEIVVMIEDVCGAIKEVSYEFELQYEQPLLLVDTITLEVTEAKVLDKDSISVALNTDATREITLLDEWSFASFLEVSVDILSGTHTGISIVALDEFPDFVGEDTVIYVNYKICEVENAVQIKCDVPGRIPVKLVRDVSDSPITLSDGDLDAEGLGLTNRQIRNNIEIVVINSAVTADVGLSFEFKWNEELINPDSLQYDLTIVSRWNDVVYQESGSGKYPEWNGENKPQGNSQNLTRKVTEGNYFWMMKVDFINENGDTKKYHKHGYLYYRPITID